MHLLSTLLSIVGIAAPATKSERNSKQLSYQQLPGRAMVFIADDLAHNLINETWSDIHTMHELRRATTNKQLIKAH
jgi:hypothetical protein